MGETVDLAPVSGTQAVTGTVSDLCLPGSYVARVGVQLASGGAVQTLLTEDFDFTVTRGTASATAVFSPSASEKAGTPIDVDFGLKHLPVNPAEYGEMVYTLGVYSTTMSGGNRVLHHAHGCEGAGFANSARGTLVNVPITPTRALETVAVAISERCPADDYVLQLKVVVSEDFSDSSETTEELLSEEYEFEILELDPAAALAFMPSDTVNHGKPISLTLTEMPATGANESIRVLWAAGRLDGNLLTPEAACEGGNFGTRSGLVPVSGTIVITGTTIARTCPAGDDYVVRASVDLEIDGSVQSSVLVADFPFAIDAPPPSFGAVFSPAESVNEWTSIDVALELRHLPTDAAEYGEMIYTLGIYSATTSMGQPTNHAYACEGAGFANGARDAVVSVPITPTMTLETVAATISWRCPPGDYVVQFDLKTSDDFSVQNPTVDVIFSEQSAFEIVDLNPAADLAFSPSDSVEFGTPIGLTLTLSDMPEPGAGDALRLSWDVGVYDGSEIEPEADCRGAGTLGQTLDLVPVSDCSVVTGTIAATCPAGADYAVQVDVQFISGGDAEVLIDEFITLTIEAAAPEAEVTFSPSDFETEGTAVTIDLEFRNLPDDPSEYGEMFYQASVIRVVSGVNFEGASECEGSGFPADDYEPYTPTVTVSALSFGIPGECPAGSYRLEFAVVTSSNSLEDVTQVLSGGVPFTLNVVGAPTAVALPTPTVSPPAVAVAAVPTATAAATAAQLQPEQFPSVESRPLAVVRREVAQALTGPHAQCHALASLAKGTQVALFGIDPTLQWLLVKVEGFATLGWIARDQVSVIGSMAEVLLVSPRQESSPLPTVRVLPAQLNARAGPGESHEIVTLLEEGTRATVVGADAAGEWLQVEPETFDRKVWVSRRLTSLDGPAGEEGGADPQAVALTVRLPSPFEGTVKVNANVYDPAVCTQAGSAVEAVDDDEVKMTLERVSLESTATEARMSLTVLCSGDEKTSIDLEWDGEQWVIRCEEAE